MAIPAKGRLRDIADRLWSLAVKSDWNYQCPICGKRGRNLNSHHLIPRQHEATRYSMENGICLCHDCHQFCPDQSPHQNAAGFLLWLELHQPEQHKWYTETIESCRHKVFKETRNTEYYFRIIADLRQYVDEAEFERIVGSTLSRWLEDSQ